MSKYQWALAAVLLAGLPALSACGGDEDDDHAGSELDRVAVEQSARTALTAGSENADVFLGLVTDDLLEDVFSFTREECEARAEECLGDPTAIDTLVVTDISGDRANVEASLDIGEFFLTLAREDNVWRIDDFTSKTPEVPAGVIKVELRADEFAFEFNRDDIPADGNFAFVVTNVGDQTHEVIVQRVPAGFDFEASLLSDEHAGELEDVGFGGPFSPGNGGNVVFGEALGPGQYLLTCYILDREDPAKVPHAQKGMFADFTIE